VTRRTDAVALVVSECEERVFGEPFFAGIVRGITAALTVTPLQLWLAMVHSQEGRHRVENYLTTQHVDGVMLLSLHDADPLPALLSRRGPPTVLGGRSADMVKGGVQQGRVRYVDVDNVGGARSAVEHLLASGRRRIAHVAGPQDMGVGVARLAGYRQALECLGGPTRRGWSPWAISARPAGQPRCGTCCSVIPTSTPSSPPAT
jgi:DNA-binding LacI/PurR family transcriptional regulator